MIFVTPLPRHAYNQAVLRTLLVVLCGVLMLQPPAYGDTDRIFPQNYVANKTLRFRPNHNQRPERILPVNMNGRWGYIGIDGVVLVLPQYEWADYFYEDARTRGLPDVPLELDRFPRPGQPVAIRTMVDINGLYPVNAAVETRYASSRARVVVDGLTGFVDKRGWWFIPPVFPYADRYSEGYAVIGNGEKYGVLDLFGFQIVPFTYDGLLRYREGMAGVLRDGRCGFIDKRGRLVIEPRYVRVRSFSEGRAMVEAPNGTLGYILRNGRLDWADKQRRFSDLGDFRGGFARARVGDRWGYIDKRYRLRVEPRFEEALDFEGGVAAVMIDGKWGYLDASFRFTVDPRYELAFDFARQDDPDDAPERSDAVLLLVQSRGLLGYINRIGRVSISPQFDSALPYFRRYARVSQPPSFGYIDVSGRVLWDPREAAGGIAGEPVPPLDPLGRQWLGLPTPTFPIGEPYPFDSFYPHELIGHRD